MESDKKLATVGPCGESSSKIPGSQSVYRAISVLRGVARHNRTGVAAKHLADEIGLTLATTHRLLKVLVSEDILTVDPYSKKYHLGYTLFQMGSAAHDFSIIRYLDAPLQKLREVTGETVFLFIRSGTDALCLRRIDGDYPIRALTLTIGSRRPLGVGAGSMALLAAQTENMRTRILASNLERFSDYFETNLEDMRQQLAATRRRGFSFNDGYLRECVQAVGMAIGPEGREPIAAVSIAASDRRMAPDRRQFLETSLGAEFAGLDWSLFNPNPNI